MFSSFIFIFVWPCWVTQNWRLKFLYSLGSVCANLILFSVSPKRTLTGMHFVLTVRLCSILVLYLVSVVIPVHFSILTLLVDEKPGQIVVSPLRICGTSIQFHHCEQQKLGRLHGYAGLSVPLLFTYVVSSLFTWASSIIK